MSQPLIVLKFGSSVLGKEADLPRAVDEIERWHRDGYRVIAVVSALADTTDRLFAQASCYGEEPDSAATAALVANGENESVALLTLALHRAGIPARLRDAASIGLRTEGPLLNASPVALEESAVQRDLEAAPVLVIPGFLGRTAGGQTSLFGRGGSDLTALFLAQRLGADRCRLIKDVPGVFEYDCAGAETPPRRYATLRWEEALALAGEIVQKKAVQFAQEHGLTFEVAAQGRTDETRVGSEPTCFHIESLAIVREALAGSVA